jgi:hypothetical protein
VINEHANDQMYNLFSVINKIIVVKTKEKRISELISGW